MPTVTTIAVSRSVEVESVGLLQLPALLLETRAILIGFLCQPSKMMCRPGSRVIQIYSLIVITSQIFGSHLTSARHLSRRRHQPQTEHPNKGRVDQMRRDLYDWECSLPKPSVVYIQDELGALPGRGVGEPPEIDWDPVAVVLHRCGRHAGCCTNYPISSCQATESFNVTLPVRKKIPETRFYLHKWVYETVTLVNHTSCACLSNPS